MQSAAGRRSSQTKGPATGRLPALVVSPAAFTENTGRAIVNPITTRMRSVPHQPRPSRSVFGWHVRLSVFEGETDLQNSLIVLHLAALDMPTGLHDLEPAEMLQRALRRLRNLGQRDKLRADRSKGA